MEIYLLQRRTILSIAMYAVGKTIPDRRITLTKKVVGTCNVVSLNHYREDWKAVRDPFDEYEKRKKANSKK